MPRDNVAANGRSAAANFQTNADLFMNIRMRLPCPRGVHNRNRIIFIYLRNRLYRVYLLFLFFGEKNYISSLIITAFIIVLM